MQKKRCWACGSLSVIGWGKQNKKQRFKCKNCEIYFTNSRKDQTIRNRFIWFKKWVLERQTFNTLTRDSKLSKSTLQRTFKILLAQAPKCKIIKRNNVHFRIDGTYFNQFCLIAYQDDFDGYTQLIRFTDGEHYHEVKEDLENLIKLGVKIESITCDGQKSVLKAIKDVEQDILIQRCLVHLQRMCLIWLTQYPKHQAGQELRNLCLMLLKIETQNDKLFWIQCFNNWFKKHKNYINEKSYNPETERYWYTHKMLRRSYSTLKKALPNMFHYLENRSIPRTTNGIEGFFSHLKNHLDLHRGLTVKNRVNFIKWYIHFSNEK